MIALHKDYSILKFDNPSKQKKRSSRRADVSEFDPYFMIGLSSDSSQGESSGDSNDTLIEKMDGVSYDSHPHNGYHPRHATHMKLVEEEHKKVRKSKRKRTKQVVKSSDPETNMFDDEVEEDSVTYSYISKRTYSIQSVNSAMLNTIANPEPYSALHQNKKSIKECVSRSDIQINRTVVKRESPPRSSTGSSSDGEFGDRVNVKKEPIVKTEVFTDEDPDICPQLVLSHYNDAYMKESPVPSSGKRAKRQAPKPPVPKLPVPKPPLPPRPKKQAPQTSSSDYKAELDSYRARLDVLSDLVLKQESSHSNGIIEDPHHHHHQPQPDYGGTDFLNTLSEKQFTNGLNRFLNDLMLRIQDKIQDGTIAFSEEEESESFDEIDEMDEEQIANSELVKPLFNTINQNRDYAKNEPMKTIGLSTAVLPTLALNMPHPSSSGLGSINTSCTTTQDSFHSIDITLPRETIGVQTDVIPARDPGPLFKHTQTDTTHRKTHSSDNANDSSDLTQTKSDVSVGCTSSEDNTKLQTHDKGVGTDDLEPEPDASVYHSILSPGGSTSSSENKSPRRRSPHLTKSPAKGVSKSTATVYTFNSKPPRPRVVESLEPTSVDSSLSRNLKGGFTFSTDCSSYERIDGIPGVSDMSKPSSGDNLSDISTPLSTLDRDAQLPVSEGSSDATSTTQREIIIEEQQVDPVENNKPSDSPERHVTWSESVQHIDPPTSKETTPRPQVAASQDPLPTAQEQFFQEDDKIDDTGQIQVESNEVPMLAIAAAVDTEPVIGHVTADVNPFPFMNLRQVDIPRSCKRTFRSRPQTPIASRRRTYSDLDYPKERKESTDSGSNEKILNNSINNISSSQELAPNILPNLASAVEAGSRARNFSATSNASNSNGDQVVFNNLGDTRSLNITGSRDSLTNISSFGSTSNIDNISYSLPEISESSFEEKKHNKPENTDIPSTSSTMQSPTSNLDDPLRDFGSNKDNYSTATLRKPMNLTNFSLKDDSASAKDVSDNVPGPSHAASDIFEPDATEQSKINFNGSPSGKSKRTIVDGKNVPQFSEIKELPSEEVDDKCLGQVSDPSNDTSMMTREDSMVAEEPEISSEISEKDCTDDVHNIEIPDDSKPDDNIPDLDNAESCVDISEDVLVNPSLAEEQVDKNVDENMEIIASEISHSPEVTDAVPVPTASNAACTGGKKGKKGKKGKRKNNTVYSLDTLPEDPPKHKDETTAKVPEKRKKGKKGKRGKSLSVSTVSYDLDLDEEPEAQVPPNLAPEETSLPMLEEIESLNNEAEQANTANGDDKAIDDKECAGDRKESSGAGAQAPENVSTVPTPEKRASVGPVERRIVFEARKQERRMSTGDENPEISSTSPRKRVPSCQSALWWEDRKQLKILPPESDNRKTDAQVDETDGEIKVEPIVSNNSDIDGNVPVSFDKLPLNEDLSAIPTDPHTISNSSMVDINSNSRVDSSNSLELNKDGVAPSVEAGQEVKMGTNYSADNVNIIAPVSKNKKKKGKNKRKFAEKDLPKQLELPDQSDALEDSEPHIKIQLIPNAVDFTESSSKIEVGDNMNIEGSLDTDDDLDTIGAQAQFTERIEEDEPLSLEHNDQLPTAHVDAAESVPLNSDKTEANKDDDFNNNGSEAVDPFVQEASEFVTKSKKKKGKKNKKALKKGQFGNTHDDYIGGMECSMNDDRKASFITPPFSQSSTIKEPSMNDDLDTAPPKEDFHAYAHQLQNEETPEIKQLNEPASGNEMNKLLNIKHTDDKPEDKTNGSRIISPEIVRSDDEFGKPWPCNKSKDDVIDTLEVADIPTPQNRDLFPKGDKTNDKFEPDSAATEASNMDPLVSATLNNDSDKPHEASEEPVATALIKENSMTEVDTESPKEVSSLTFPHVVTEVLEAIPAKKKKKGKKSKGNKNADLNGESICDAPTSTGKKKGKGKKGKKKQIIPDTSTATVNEGDNQVTSQDPIEVHDVPAKDEEDVTLFKEIVPAPGEIVVEGESNLSLENDLVGNDQPISFSEEDKVPLVEPTSLRTAEDSIIILAAKPELGNLDLSSLSPSILEKDRRDDNGVQGGRKSRTPDHHPKDSSSDEPKNDPRRRTMSDDATIPFPRKPRRYSSLNLLPPSDLTGRSTSFTPEDRFDYEETDLSDTPMRKQAGPLTGSKEGVFPKTVYPKVNYKGPPIKPFRQSVSSKHQDTALYPDSNNLAVASGRTRSLSENDPGISSKGDKKYRPEKFKDWLFGQILPSRIKSSENYCQNDLLMSVPVGEIRSTGDSHVRVGDDARLEPSHKTAEESLIATDGQSEQIDVSPHTINLERPTVLTLDRPFSYSGEKASTEDDEATPKPIQKTPSANDVLCSNTAYVNWLHTLSAIQNEKSGSVKNLLTVPKRPCHRKTHSEGQKIEVTFMKELSPVLEPKGKPPTPPPFASTHKVSSRPRVRSAVHASEETKTSPLSEAKTPSADDINKSWKGLLKSWILNNGGSQSKVKSSNDICKGSSSKERRGSEIIETEITFPTEVNIPPKISQIDLSSDTRSRENSRTESVSGVSTGFISNNEFSADIDSFLDSEIDKLKDDYIPQKPSKSKKKKRSKRKSTERDFSSPMFDNFDHVPNCPVVEVTQDTFEAAEDPCIQTIVPSNYERISHLFDDSVVPDNNEAPNIKSMNLPTERKRGSYMEAADNKFNETTSIRSFEYDDNFDGFTVSRYLDGALDKLKSRSVSNSSSSDGGFPNFPVQSTTTMPSLTVDKRDFGVSVDGCQGGKRGRLPGSSSFTHNDHLDDDSDAFKTRTSSGFNPSFEKSPSSEILKEIKSPPRLNVTSSFISFDRDPTPPQKPQRPAKPVLFSYVEDCARDEFREITDVPESSTFGNRSHSESELSVPEKEVKKSFKKQLLSRWGRRRTRSESKSCRDGKVDKSHGDGLDVLNASEQDMIMTPKKNVQVFKLADGREIKYDMETRKETVISNPNNVAHEVPPEIKSTSLLPVLDQLDRIQSTFDDLALCIADSSKPSSSHVRRANSLPGESSFGKLSGGKTPQTDQWGKEIDLDMKELTDLINNFCKDKGEYHNNSVEDILDAMVCSKERQSSDSFDSAHSNDSFKSITADKVQINTISAKERKKKTLLSLLSDLNKSKSTSAINSSTSSSNGVGQSSRSEANVSSLGHNEVMTDGILAAEVTNAPITAATMPVPIIVVDPPSTKTSKVKSKGFFENLKSKKYHTSSEDVTTPKSRRTRAYSDSRAYKEEKVGFFENLKSKKYHESDEFELDENGFLSHVLKTKKYHRSSDWIGPKRKVERGFSNALTRDPSIPQPRPLEQILIHDGPPIYHQQGPVHHICLDSDPIPQYYDDRSLPKQKMNDQRVDDKYSTLPKGRGRSISISPPEDSLWGSSQISERPDSSLRRTRFNSDCNNRPIPSRQRNYSDHTLHDIHSLPDIPGPDKIPRSRNKSSISNLSSITSPASDISTGFSDIDSLPNVPDHPLTGNLKIQMKRPDFLPLGVLTDTELDEVFSSIRETDDVDTKESSSGPTTMPVTSTPRRPTNLKLLNLSADRLVFDFGKESSESAPETPKFSDDGSAQIKGEKDQQGKDEKDFDVQRDKTLSATHLKSSSSEDAIYVQRSQIRNSYGKSSNEDKFIPDSLSTAKTVEVTKTASDDKVFVSRSEIGPDYGKDDEKFDIATIGSLDDETAENISMLYDIEARLNKLSSPGKDAQSDQEYSPLKYDDSSSSSQLSAGFQESVEDQGSPEYTEKLSPAEDANDSVATDRDSPIIFSATENIESKDSKPYYNLSYVTDVSLNDSNNDSFKTPARQGLSLNLNNSSENLESSVQSDKIFVLREDIHSDYGGDLSNASSHSPSIDKCDLQSSPSTADANDSLSLSTEFSRNFISISKQVGGSEEFFLPYSVYDDSPDPALTSVDIRDEDYHTINKILNDGNEVDSNTETPTFRRPSVDSSSSCATFYSGIESDSNYTSVEEDVASEFEDEKHQDFQSMPQLFTGSPTLLGGSVVSVGSNISSSGLYSDGERESEPSQINLDSTITDAVHLTSNLFQVASCEDVEETVSSHDIDDRKPGYEVIEYGANGVSICPSYSNDNNLTEIDGFCLNDLSETVDRVSEPTGTLDIDIVEDCDPSVGDVNCEEYPAQISSGEENKDQSLVVEDVTKSSDNISLISLPTQEVYESNDDLFVVEEKIQVKLSKFDGLNESSSVGITITSREEVFSPVSEYLTDVDTYYTSADDDVTSAQEEECIDWSDFEQNLDNDSDNPDTTTVFDPDSLLEEDATRFTNSSLISISTAECELSSQESIVAEEDLLDSGCKEADMNSKINKLKESMSLKEKRVGQFEVSHGSEEDEILGENNPDYNLYENVTEKSELVEGDVSVSPSSSCLSISTTSCDSQDDSQSEPPNAKEELSDTKSQNAKMNYKISLLKESRITSQGLLVEDINVSPCGSCVSLSTTCCSEDEYQPGTVSVEEKLLDKASQDLNMNLKISLLKENIADGREEEGEFQVSSEIKTEVKSSFGCENQDETSPVDLDSESSCSESLDDFGASSRSNFNGMARFGSRSDVDTYYTSADDDRASVLAEDCIEPSSCSPELYHRGLKEENISSDCEEICELIEATEIIDSSFDHTELDGVSAVKMDKDEIASFRMSSKINALLKLQEEQAVTTDDLESAKIGQEYDKQPDDSSNEFTFEDLGLTVEDVSVSPSGSCVSISTTCCPVDEHQCESIHAEEEFKDTTAQYFSTSSKINQLMKILADEEEADATFAVSNRCDDEESEELSENMSVGFEEETSCSDSKGDLNKSDSSIPHNSLSCDPMSRFSSRSDVDTYYTSADDDKASVLAEDCIEPSSSSTELHGFGVVEEDVPFDSSDRHYDESQVMTFEDSPDITDSLFTEEEIGQERSFSLMDSKIKALKTSKENQKVALQINDVSFSIDGSFEEKNFSEDFRSIKGVDIDKSPSNSCVSLSTASCAGSMGNLDEIKVEQSFTELSSSQFDERVNSILQGKPIILETEISNSVYDAELNADKADIGPGYVLTDVDTYYTSADDDCTSVAAEDCFVWTDECTEASSLIENSALDVTVPCDILQEDIYCEDHTSIIDETGSSISDDHDESGLIIEDAPSSNNENNHQQILIVEAYFSENDQEDVPCAEFEVHLADISQMVGKVKNLLMDRESSSVKDQNSGSELSSSDETTADKNSQQSSKCPPDAEENEVLGFSKTPSSDDASILPNDSVQEGAGELSSGPDKDIAEADDCFPSESNSDESLEEIPGIHIEDEPYSVKEDTELPPDDDSSFELLEMSAVELLDVSDGQEICRTPDLSTYSVDCDQADEKMIQTDAETHYSSPDDDYASEGQFDCLPSKTSVEQTNPIYDYDGLMTTVCLPDLGSISLNLSQSNVNDIQSPDSDLTPMNATDYEVTPVVASKSLLPDFIVEKDDTEDPLVDFVKNHDDEKEDLLVDLFKNHEDNSDDALGNPLKNQEEQYLGVPPSLSDSDSSLVIVGDSSVSHCSLQIKEENSCPEENIASTLEMEAIVPECYYSSANEAAVSDGLTAYMSFENLPPEKPVSLVTEDSLTKVSDLSEGQIEESPSSIPVDSDTGVVQRSSLDVSSPPPFEPKRVKKYRKKRKSSQNCPKVQGSSTSQDEHSDYVYVERPRPQTHKRALAAAAAVESTEAEAAIVKENSASPVQSSKDVKDVDVQPELEVVEVPTSPCKDIIALNLSLEQNSFEKLRCTPEDTPVSIRRDSATEGQGELEQKVDSDGSASPRKCTSVPQKDVEQGLQSCCPTLTQRRSEEPQLTEESELEFLTVLHGLKPIPKSEFFEVKRTVSPIKKKPSRRHMQSWARHLLSKTSSPEVVSGDTADDTEVLPSENDFVALNPVETVVATPVESLLLSPIPSPYGTLKRPRIFSGSRNRSSASNSSSDKGVEKKVDDEVEGIYFDGKNAPSKANKIHTTGLSSVLFDDKSALSDVDEDMDKFEEELCREHFKLVMNELTFAVKLFQTADSDGSASPNGSHQTAAEPTEPMPSTSKTNFLDLSFCDSTCDDVSRVQEAIHQQYYNQVVREIKDWSYDPDCELDGDKLMARLRIHSEPSSSEGEPPPDCISRGSAMCGSDSEVCTPQKFSGLDAHPCPDSPYQKAHSMSVILKSRDTGKYKSKWKTCRNPECEACQRRRKRRSDRWKNWKILNQDGNPCETN